MGARRSTIASPIGRHSTVRSPYRVLGLERATVLRHPSTCSRCCAATGRSAQRENRPLTVMRFDVDAYRGYQDVFGRMATENVMRQVGRTISSAMRRLVTSSRVSATTSFVVLGLSMDREAACHHAEMILGRIRALAIHHPRSQTGRYLTAAPGSRPVCPAGLAQRCRSSRPSAGAARRKRREWRPRPGCVDRRR